MKWFLAAILMLSSAGRAELAVRAFCEERWKDDDLALFVPQRQELICRSGAGGPWGFSFAGFQTAHRGPIDLEVMGSGGYESHDVFSIAALSLDFGREGGGWSQRTLLGLGLIGAARPTHPPGWGVGAAGKTVCRGSLLNAGPKPQRVKIDPSKYAPADWDGRLWIGLLLHNAGAGKSLSARIIDPPSAAAPAGLNDAQQWKLLSDHQRQFLRRAVDEIEHTAARPPPMEGLAEEMKPYAAAAVEADNPPTDALRRALDSYDKSPAGAQGFLKLAEDFFAWQQRANQPRPADKLNAFFNNWKADGSFGKELGCVIRAASNLEKVGLSDLDSGRIFSPSQPIEISAARHEYEGFQIVLTPLPGCTEHVTVHAGDLTGPGGTIPPSAVTINAVGYVRIFGNRLVPDPLLIGDVPALKPGENQPIWVTVHVPPATRAGEYLGKITINDLAIPVKLRVRDFDIPKKISLRSSFWMFRDQINRFYHLDEVSLDDYLEWIDCALAHRVNPIDVYEGYCKPLLDISLPEQKWDAKNTTHIGTPNPHPDFSKWDRYLDRMVAGGASTLHLGTTHHFGNFFKPDANTEGTPLHIERVKRAVAIMAEHYKQRGLFDMHYLQLRDETSESASVNVYRGVHGAFPDVKLLLTVPSPEARPFVRIACPQTPGLDVRWRDEAHARGDEYWWYVCLSPPDPYANLMLHQSAPQHRALFWQTWSNHVDGLLYWGMNFWSWYESKWPADVKYQTQRVPPEGAPSVIPLPDAPGDGFSIYPGRTPGEPMSSIRLEAIRDGEEDYEYFILLDKLIAKAEKSRAEALIEARAARDDAKKLVANMTEYERRPDPYLRIRDRIAESIERLAAK